VIFTIYLLTGTLPNAGVVVGIMLIGVGIGLVVARFGNMGPFQGEFGSPWFEVELVETLRKEVARASRFDRELSIVVARQHDGPPVSWDSLTRASDDVVVCRNGWHVVILPETDKDGAQAMVERVVAEPARKVQVVIMDPTVHHYDSDKLGAALLDLVRHAPPSQEAVQTTLVVQRDTDRLRWPAG
jgi:hypothetical protein